VYSHGILRIGFGWGPNQFWMFGEDTDLIIIIIIIIIIITIIMNWRMKCVLCGSKSQHK